MTRLFFTIAFLIILYVITVLAIYFVGKKRDFQYNKALLSKDIFNVCKGLAIALIMLSHIGNNFGIRYLTPLGSFGVAVFLFCSGYGLQMSAQKNGLKGYWFRRIKTAYLPYFIIELVGYIFLYNDIKFIDAVKDLLLIQTIHIWLVYAMLILILHSVLYSRINI